MGVECPEWIRADSHGCHIQTHTPVSRAELSIKRWACHTGHTGQTSKKPTSDSESAAPRRQGGGERCYCRTHVRGIFALPHHACTVFTRARKLQVQLVRWSNVDSGIPTVPGFHSPRQPLSPAGSGRSGHRLRGAITALPSSPVKLLRFLLLPRRCVCIIRTMLAILRTKTPESQSDQEGMTPPTLSVVRRARTLHGGTKATHHGLRRFAHLCKGEEWCMPQIRGLRHARAGWEEALGSRGGSGALHSCPNSAGISFWS